MDERSDQSDKIDEIMLPGFRFHPTDEELVGFYLKRKIQQRPLSIELIRQLDIYKYDPWDLPKLATTGEKEWYFYCPRDRKYRNSARPNRVTGAGFWKATGTDRPIYNSEGSKCIGLKKSLVFYQGRAAKGVKTDWMMHEFRLPSVTDSISPKRFVDKNVVPANEAWAICRIFKKANSNAQRAYSHSLISPIMPDTTPSGVLNTHHASTQLLNPSSNMSLTNKTSSSHQLINDIDHSSIASFSPLDVPSYELVNNHIEDKQPYSSTETSDQQYSKCTISYNNDVSSMLLNMSSPTFGDFDKSCVNVKYNGALHDLYTSFSPALCQGNNACQGEEIALIKEQNVAVHLDEQWGAIKSIDLPFGFPLSMPEAWKSSLLWDSSPCPSELSTNYSTNNCYT